MACISGIVAGQQWRLCHNNNTLNRARHLLQRHSAPRVAAEKASAYNISGINSSSSGINKRKHSSSSSMAIVASLLV